MLRAGQLRERVGLARRLDGGDGAGNAEGDWGPEIFVAARIVPLRGGEEVLAARLAGRQPVLVTVSRSRAMLEVTTAWRLTDARTGTIYNIRTVSPSEDKTAIDMMCEAGVAV